MDDMTIFSVAQFLAYVNDTFKAIWDPTQIALEGEVSGFRISQGQWVNFDVKDEDALVSVFMVARNLTMPIQDGMRVRLYGCPRIYPKFGKFSFSADRVEIVGEGGLRKALELLRQKLTTEGLLDIERKRSLPRFPKRVALIASRESAAYGDFIRILNERWNGLEIDLYHVLVQGKDAPDSLVNAIERANRKGEGVYDVLIVTRGGGSLEELMAFNDERVVRSIFASKIPTLVGIGHERDITLAEEVADVRGSTPTDCARRLVPDKRDLLLELANLEEGLTNRLQNLIQEHLIRIERALVGARHWLQVVQGRVDTVANRALEEGRQWHRRLVERVDTMDRVIRAADPELILKRGYALVASEDGHVRVRAQDIRPGESLSLRFADGKVTVEVEGAAPKNLRLL
jgi:exodeoxyribonuclease VII large subunit